MNHPKRILLLLFVMLCAHLHAQNETIDSLRKKFYPGMPDSVRSYWSDVIAREYQNVDLDSGLYYANQTLRISRRIGLRNHEIDANNTLSVIHRNLGEYEKAINFGLEALRLCNQYKAKSHYYKNTYTTLNLAYTEQGNYTAGIEYGFKVLQELQKEQDTLAMAMAYNNIANTYFQLSNFDKAMQYYKNALVLAKQLKHVYGEGLLVGNIGSVFFSQAKLDSSKVYFDRFLAISEQLKDEEGIALANSNLGSYYQEKGDDRTAIDYFEKAAGSFKKLQMTPSLASNYRNISHSLLRLNQVPKAIEAGRKALELSGQMKSFPHLEAAHLALNRAYEKANDIPKAYFHYREYIAARDSIYNEKNRKDQFKAEISYEYNKKRYADSLQQQMTKKMQAEELEQEREKTQTQRKLLYTAVAALVLMMVLAVFIYRSYKEKKRSNLVITGQKIQVEAQKEKIEQQKMILETRNREVTDSINYARRLQEAILPPKTFITSVLPESFFLYKPKDIVAGDFYWVEKCDDILLFAAADCTGHGVPGAMVSVVCSNALNRTVKEFGITEPGKILDKVRDLVLQTFEKSESAVNDGMDISLCALDTRSNELKWSGANNPLWMIRDGQLHEIRGSKQSVGKTENPQPFPSHSLLLKKNDHLYLFTDGYADQFGGPKGKKFKQSALKEMLLSVSQKPMSEQYRIVDQTLRDWQSHHEQVDDILVIGIRI